MRLPQGHKPLALLSLPHPTHQHLHLALKVVPVQQQAVKRKLQDVILGPPWLERNHIVIDHHLRTVVDKQTNYNFLDPKPLPPLKPPLVKLRDKLKKTKTDHKLLATELKAVCAARLERLTAENTFEDIREVDVVATVRERIETLAELARYQEPGEKLKDRYNPIFSLSNKCQNCDSAASALSGQLTILLP
ncbi:hypothetical protein B0H19DRAFT_1062367 [Mycena capillaripes]|nr:hypothetical protein B0H19DRAFT_1062367 [Mycena capillaripes]